MVNLLNDKFIYLRELPDPLHPALAFGRVLGDAVRLNLVEVYWHWQSLNSLLLNPFFPAEAPKQAHHSVTEFKESNFLYIRTYALYSNWVLNILWYLDISLPCRTIFCNMVEAKYKSYYTVLNLSKFMLIFSHTVLQLMLSRILLALVRILSYQYSRISCGESNNVSAGNCSWACFFNFGFYLINHFKPSQRVLIWNCAFLTYNFLAIIQQKRCITSLKWLNLLNKISMKTR